MSARAVSMAVFRGAAVVVVLAGAAALAGWVGRVMPEFYPGRGAGREGLGADGSDRGALPAPPTEKDEFASTEPDPGRFDRELAARLSDSGADGKPVKLPDSLPVPEGGRALAVPGLSSGGPATMYAVECSLARADAVDWLRKRSVELGWKVESVRAGPDGDDRVALGKDDLSRCWARIEDRAGGGTRIHYMLLDGEAVKTRRPR
jgi:hypothetical protein